MVRDYYVLAVDIEASGSSKSRNGIVSIGASLQNSNSTELASFQINLALADDKAYDEKCLTEFWHKYPAMYNFVQENAIAPAQAINKFTNFINQIEQTYNQHGQLQVVSDNPRFDIAWLNDYIDQYTACYTLDYNMFGEFRFIWDVNSMMKVLLAITKQNNTANWGFADRLNFRSKWIADHNPLNDARVIADYYNQTVKNMIMLGRAYEYR